MYRKANAMKMKDLYNALYDFARKNENLKSKIVDYKDVEPNFTSICREILETPMIKSDLSKVDLGGECFRCTKDDDPLYNVKLGPQMLRYNDNKELSIIICCLSDDWESPVVFVLYVDENNKFRAYIPEDGNCYCKKYHCAYGSVGEYTDLDEKDSNLSDEEFEKLYSGQFNENYSYDKLLNDIKNRIVLD